MNSRPKIFLDLDGVITDFVSSSMAFHDAWIPGEAYYPAGFGWDVVGATNHVRGAKGIEQITAELFWDSLDYDFWRELKPYSEAERFIEKLQGIGDLYFATSPTLSSDCVAGKFDWVKDNYPNMLRRTYIGAKKDVFAGPNTFLIDDRDKNVSEFNEAGGRGILVPRPWNYGGYWGSGIYNMIINFLVEQCD